MLCCVLTLISLNHNKNAPPAQLSPQLYIAHSSAAPCGAVRCRALPCGAVCFMLRCAFFRTYSSCDRYMMRSARYTRYRYVRICTRLFLASSSKLIVLSPYVPPPRILKPHCRSKCDIANKYTAYCTAQCTAQAGQQLIAPRKQLLALSIH